MSPQRRSYWEVTLGGLLVEIDKQDQVYETALAEKDKEIRNLEERYDLLADEFRMAVEAGGALFQGKDAPFHDLLKPGQRILVDGFKALANEIERLNMVVEAAAQGDS